MLIVDVYYVIIVHFMKFYDVLCLVRNAFCVCLLQAFIWPLIIWERATVVASTYGEVSGTCGLWIFQSRLYLCQ